MAKKLSTNQKISIAMLILTLAGLIVNSVYQTISILNFEKQQKEIIVSLEEIKAKVGIFENLTVNGIFRQGETCSYNNGTWFIMESNCTI